MAKEIKEENTVTISGKDLITFLEVDPREYRSIYPQNGIEGYCPCMDLGLEAYCAGGMLTVMKVLKKNEITEFPERTVRVKEKDYNSGEVWIDDCYNIAYLYLGQLPNKKDVVLNLGGQTHNQGNIEIGYINCKIDRERIFFSRQIFPSL